MAQLNSDDILVYVGTYTRRLAHVMGKSEGIYVYRMDPSSGDLTHVSTTKDIDNPSFLALHPTRNFLYAVNEVNDFGDAASGAVSALALNPDDGSLTVLNQVSSQGTAPCHLCVDGTGNYVLTANYGSGSFAILPIQEDGSLAGASDYVQHAGSSVIPERQAGPHAHSVTLSPDDRYAYVADLGLDRIMIYLINWTDGTLTPNPAQQWAQVAPGAGPRHMAFHPNGRVAYVINEIGSTMTVFAFDAAAGTLEEVQTISTLPDDFSGRSHTADVHVHPTGRFVYGSNRGHDSIVCFAADPGDGTLTTVGYESTQGEVPRNFALDPTGAFLYAANQNSDNVVAYRIDADSGQLTPTGHITQVPTPVCLKFLA